MIRKLQAFFGSLRAMYHISSMQADEQQNTAIAATMTSIEKRLLEIGSDPRYGMEREALERQLNLLEAKAVRNIARKMGSTQRLKDVTRAAESQAEVEAPETYVLPHNPQPKFVRDLLAELHRTFGLSDEEQLQCVKWIGIAWYTFSREAEDSGQPVTRESRSKLSGWKSSHAFSAGSGREAIGQWIEDAAMRGVNRKFFPDWAEAESLKTERSSEADLRALLKTKMQERLEELDEEAALVLVAQLRAQMAAENVEIEGMRPIDYPMAVGHQVRIMRVIYAGVGKPFDAVFWYGQMIMSWLLMSRQHDVGRLTFDYRQACADYRETMQNQGWASDSFGESAFANMRGSIYQLITGEEYDYNPPD